MIGENQDYVARRPGALPPHVPPPMPSLDERIKKVERAKALSESLKTWQTLRYERMSEQTKAREALAKADGRVAEAQGRITEIEAELDSLLK